MIKFSGCSAVLVIYFWLLDCSAMQSEIQVQHVDNDFGSSVRQQCEAAVCGTIPSLDNDFAGTPRGP